MSLGEDLPADDEDYSSYTQVAFFEGPSLNTKDPDYSEIFSIDPPVCGRYFALQRTHAPYDRAYSVLEIEEVEVYTLEIM